MEYFVILLFLSVHLLAYIDNEEYFYKNAHVEYGFYTLAGFLLIMKVHFNFSDKIVLNLVFIIGGVLFYLLYIKKLHEPRTNEIKAKQINFWGIDKKNIFKHTKKHIVQKKGRKELELDTLDSLRNDYFVDLDENGFKTIHNNFLLLHLKDYNHFTIHKEEVETFFSHAEHDLYRVVFEKIKFFISETEEDIDLEEILRNNNHCIEFFLIELWGKYAQTFSIGIGTLQTLIYNKEDSSKNENLETLLYALDASANSVIHRKGFPLYFYYYHFKTLKKKGRKYGN